MPAPFTVETASGGSASTRSTCPESSAETRVLASGMGRKTIRSCCGTMLLFQ